jgi:hypothetical protein
MANLSLFNDQKKRKRIPFNKKYEGIKEAEDYSEEINSTSSTSECLNSTFLGMDLL